MGAQVNKSGGVRHSHTLPPRAPAEKIGFFAKNICVIRPDTAGLTMVQTKREPRPALRRIGRAGIDPWGKQKAAGYKI